MTNKWLLPEGIDEALPAEAMWLEALRRELLDMYKSWGYELLMPPFIEYMDSLLISSPTHDVQTFKLTDQLTGKMMGVRPDMTPQVARIDAHRLLRSGPARYCYLGTVLKTRPDNFAGSRSPMQVGVEFYGHAGLESDLEVLRLMIETIVRCGIRNIHIDLGDASLVNHFAEQAGFSVSDTDRLYTLLQRKAVTDLASFVEQRDMPASISEALLALPDLNGDESMLELANKMPALQQAGCQASLKKLQQLANLLKATYPDLDVNFDLAEVSGFRYQNGVVFAAYMAGEGRELARGGRYDGIGESFGEARAATGFSADLKNLMSLGDRAIEDSTDKVLAPRESSAELQELIEKLRVEGKIVVESVDGELLQDYTHQLMQIDGSWQVQSVQNKD